MGAQKPVRVVFFDFGKTLIDYNLDYFFNWLEMTFSVPRHRFWGLFTGDLLQRYERGLGTDEFIREFRTNVAEVLRMLGEKDGTTTAIPQFTDAEFLHAWNSVFAIQWNYQERFGTMRKLRRKGYKVYVLSNTNEAHVRYFRGTDERRTYARSPFLEAFNSCDRFIASCDPDVRERKTMYDGTNREECERIFWRALAIAGAEPSEAVFVDDIANFTETFKRMGGRAILCTGNWTKVEHELYQFGARWK